MLVKTGEIASLRYPFSWVFVKIGVGAELGYFY